MASTSDTYRAYLSHSEPITAEEIVVAYDGVLYKVMKDAFGGYGNRILINQATNFGDFPFYIIYNNGRNEVLTSTSGQHTIEISEDTSKIETTECFKKAVRSVVGGVMMLNLIIEGDETFSIEGATWQQAYDAIQNGTMLFLRDDIQIHPCVSCAYAAIVFNSISVYSDRVNASSYVWVSDGTVTIQELNYPSNT